ncbi:YbaK/EbsC family protein [Tabrizicola sp.]|uniref:YbaK/EbsC family protein n=1 Tax=Tabrizicola sp. TaxID=2005166 RepID=UPI00273322F4|nr:YbaK/EbsC family protein [Tabrizicola sp.]MDP3196485.1 YbaK/EbsC family protein [Tabrizicola sp.]
MSKSLARVTAALEAAGLPSVPVAARGEIRTAEAAAAEAGVAVDQIVKSILFQGDSGRLVLFLTAGGNRVDLGKAAALAGEPLSRAGVEVVRSVTGFAIGGVAPLGHLTPSPTFLDPRLLDFAEVWAAAGTPRHMFGVDPQSLVRATAATVADFTG